MKTLLFIPLLIALFSYQSYTYSLEGRWAVKSQYLPNDVNASVTFQKHLNNTNSRIHYYMNVFACRLIRYRYIVVDNQIYLTFDQFLTQRYPCKPNEISTIRNKLEKVFFFYIVGTQLAFYGANGSAQFQMSRLPIPSPKTLAGQWVTIDVNGAFIQEPISASNTTFELCEGKGNITYTIPSSSKPDISFVINKVSGCAQNEIFSTLNRVKYFRWRNANLVYLYDSNSEQIMTVRKIKDRVVENPEVKSDSKTQSTVKTETNPTATQVTTQTKIPSTSSSSTQNNHNNQNKNSLAVTETVLTPTVKPMTPVVTPQKVNPPLTPTPIVPVVPKPTETKPSQQPQVIVQPVVKAPQAPISPPKVPSTPKPSQTPLANPPSASSTITPAKQYKFVSDLPMITSTQFAGKWLIMDQQYSSLVYKYFFLMVGDRITLYGDCQVHLSTFSLSNSTLDKINVRSITSATSANASPGFNCDESKQRISALIEKWRKWKYVAVDSKDGIVNLQILDDKFAVLNNLQKI